MSLEKVVKVSLKIDFLIRKNRFFVVVKANSEATITRITTEQLKIKMSLLARNRRVATLARSFSTEAPKIRIAQGILRLSQIQRAKDENELKKALSAPAAAIDLANLPKELAGLERYFAGAATTASGSAFTADKTAWQNTDWASFIGSEVGRYEVWPFAVGFG